VKKIIKVYLTIPWKIRSRKISQKLNRINPLRPKLRRRKLKNLLRRKKRKKSNCPTRNRKATNRRLGMKNGKWKSKATTLTTMEKSKLSWGKTPISKTACKFQLRSKIQFLLSPTARLNHHKVDSATLEHKKSPLFQIISTTWAQ